MQRVLLFFWCQVMALSLHAQCNAALNDALTAYEAGQISSIDLSNCLDQKKLKRAKLIDAYELMTEVALYRDSTDKAIEYFNRLLFFNPLFKIDTLNNSYDLIYLAQTYNRRPFLIVNSSIGINFTHVQRLQSYGVDNLQNPAESYFPLLAGLSGRLGLSLPVGSHFELSTELAASFRRYNYSDSMLTSVNAQNPTGEVPLWYSDLRFSESHLWLNIPLSIQYNFTEKKRFLPYVYGGGSADLLLQARLNGPRRSNAAGLAGGDEVRIDLMQRTQSQRSNFNFSLFAGLGTRIRMGRNFLFLDMRYQANFLNLVNPENRYANKELLYDIGFVDNDFRTRSVSFSIGFAKAFYTARQKRRYQRSTVEKRVAKWAEREKKDILRQIENETIGASQRELRSAINRLENKKESMIRDAIRGRLDIDAKGKIKDALED